ncbi:MAG: hypothetical protein ABSG25_13825 [Bryobacteraceae bacterium]
MELYDIDISRLQKTYIDEIDGIKIYTVNGNAVKLKYDPDYDEGGNGYAKKYISKDEIWIDNNLREICWNAVILHELTELELMRDKGLSYDDAHNISNKVEMQYRFEKGII